MWHHLLASTGQHGIISNTLTVFSVLLGLAVVIAVLTKFVRIPYTIALVLAGLLVAILGAAPEGAVITQELVFALAIGLFHGKTFGGKGLAKSRRAWEVSQEPNDDSRRKNHGARSHQEALHRKPSMEKL